MNSAVSAHRSIQRNLDRGYKKVHAPIANRSAGTNPPMVIVVGSTKSWKDDSY